MKLVTKLRVASNHINSEGVEELKRYFQEKDSDVEVLVEEGKFWIFAVEIGGTKNSFAVLFPLSTDNFYSNIGVTLLNCGDDCPIVSASKSSDNIKNKLKPWCKSKNLLSSIRLLKKAQFALSMSRELRTDE